MVHCTERRLSLHFLLSSSTRVCPDRSPPGAVSSEKRLSLPWCCWGGEGGRLIGNSRGGPGSSLSLFTPRPAVLTYPLPSPLPPVWVPPVLSFSRPVENPAGTSHVTQSHHWPPHAAYPPPPQLHHSCLHHLLRWPQFAPLQPPLPSFSSSDILGSPPTPGPLYEFFPLPGARPLVSSCLVIEAFALTFF